MRLARETNDRISLARRGPPLRSPAPYHQADTESRFASESDLEPDPKALEPDPKANMA
jgi:hypothetical protein